MAAKLSEFIYSPSCKLLTWGSSFDSLTELKFAVSVLEDYAFLSQPVSIYYDLGTRQPVNNVRRCHRRYTPDFLIRHRQTGNAFLIEIKPREYEGHPQLSLRKQVAENFIRWKGFDWRFKIIFDDEIFLTEEQLFDFDECSRLRSKSDQTKWFKQYCQRWVRNGAFVLGNNPSDVQFIFYGDKGKELNQFPQ